MFTRRAPDAATAGRGRALRAFKGNPYLFLGRRPFREEVAIVLTLSTVP